MITTLFRGRFKTERNKVTKLHDLTDSTDGSVLSFKTGWDIFYYKKFAEEYIEKWGDINLLAVPRTLDDVWDPQKLTIGQTVARIKFWGRRNSTRSAASAAPTTRTCGNCRYIRYTGINEVTLHSGSCQRYKETLVACAMHNADASECPCWAPRGKNKIVNEQRQAVMMGQRLRDAKISRRHS